MADLVTEAGADRILTMTLHSPQIMGFCRIPIDQLSGVATICESFRTRSKENTVAVAPDISRAKVTEEYARYLGLPLVVVDKRLGKDGAMEVHGVIGDVAGRDVVFFDDEIVTGDSILEGAQAVRDRGSRSIYAGCVHGTLAGTAHERITASDLQELAVTDTIPLRREAASERITVCSVAGLFADAIKAIHHETSISELFT